MSSLHFKNQSSTAPMHTHRDSVPAVVRAANKKGRTKTNPSSARCGFFLKKIERAERLFGVGVPSRRQKQTEILFANPGKKKNSRRATRKRLLKKKSCVNSTLNLFFLFADECFAISRIPGLLRERKKIDAATL
jgi:hypothetical protein